MTKSSIQCNFCGKTSLKENRDINRNQKLGRENYCGHSCASSAHILKHPELKDHLKTGSTTDEFSPFRKYWTTIGNRKSKRSVTIENLKDLWDKQNGICAITGLPMIIRRCTTNYMKTDSPYLASLDRIDSSGDYSPDNIQWVCLSAQYAKHDFEEKDVIAFFKDVARQFSTGYRNRTDES